VTIPHARRKAADAAFFFLECRRGLARVCRPGGTEGRGSARSASTDSRSKARAPTGADRAANREAPPRFVRIAFARMRTRRATSREVVIEAERMASIGRDAISKEL
jgi:hypothetical protein